MDINDPETKKRIEQNKQEALRRLALNQQRQAEQLKNSEKATTSSRYSPQNPSKAQSSSILRNVNNNSAATVSKLPTPSNAQVNNRQNSNNPWEPKITSNIKASMHQRPTPYQQKQNVTSSSASKVPVGNNNQPPTSPPKKEIKCTIEIISEHRFQIRTSVYDEEVINEMKKINSRSWSQTLKVWSFALSDYKQLISSLESKFKDLLKIEKVPDFVIRNLLRESPPLNESCLDNIEPKILNSLMSFQREGVVFGVSRGGRVMICDDPGLGKTRQALGIVSFYRDDLPALIVTNASTREFWKNEILDMFNLPDNSVRILPCYIDEAKFVICSYQALDQHLDELMTKGFSILIFDESHNIKNPKAKQTTNAQKLCRSARRIIMLSGTPALSRPVELFPQLEMLDKSFATFNQYALRYCGGHQTHFGFNTTGSTNMAELEILLKKRFLIRRIKSEVFDELQNKERESIILENLSYSEDEKKDMDDFKSQMGTRIDNASAKDEVLIKWYQSTALLKARAVCAFIENLLKTTNEKILAFGHHGIMLNALSAHLEKLRIAHIRIDGGTIGSVRSDRVETFQNNPKVRVAVLSTLAANAGITLTAASCVVFCELEFNPSTIIQAEGRAHRIGQKNQVKVYFLLAPGTADDVIWKMLMKKQTNLGKAGLVDAIEYLSNTMKVTKFDCQAPPEENNSLNNNETDESANESVDTFYSCNTYADESPVQNNQEAVDDFPMSTEELEEIRRLEEEILRGEF